MNSKAINIAIWIIGILLILVSGVFANDCYVRQSYSYYYAQPVVAVPLVYYSAGQSLIQEANVEKIAQRVYQLQQQQQRKPIQAPMQAQVQAPRQQTNAPPLSILAERCAECHSGANPKKGIVIDGVTQMLCHQVTSAIRAIRDNRMPEHGPALSNAEKALALEELLALESRLPPEPVGNDLPPLPELRPRQDTRPREDGNLQ